MNEGKVLAVQINPNAICKLIKNEKILNSNNIVS